MAEGEIVADGPTAEVVVASPAFAPQVAKILAPAARGSPSTSSQRAGVVHRGGDRAVNAIARRARATVVALRSSRRCFGVDRVHVAVLRRAGVE